MKVLAQFYLLLILNIIANYNLAKGSGQEKDNFMQIVIKEKTATLKQDGKDITKIIITEKDLDKSISVKIDKKQNLKVFFRNGDNDIDSIVFSETLDIIEGNKVIKALFKCMSCDKIAITFSDPAIKFNISGELKGEIFIDNPSPSQNNQKVFDSNYNFLPSSFARSEEKWPSFISDKNENIKYRFAIDFSGSFSQATLWELQKTHGKDEFIYKIKNVIKPKYLRFITLSIKNYYPQYDSIITSTSYNTFNLEGRSIFEKYENKIVAPSSVDSSTIKKVSAPPSATSKETEDTASIFQLFRKLNSDLLQYSNYLYRNIINKSIWLNDVQYINSRLNNYFGLIDYSVSGLHTKLKEQTKGLVLNKEEENLMYNILTNYANIMSYSILSTSPLQIKDMDLLTYNIDFFKEGKKIETRDYSFLIKGGFKIDFSTGFAYSSLKDESYQIISAGTRKDTTFYIDNYFKTTDSITGLTTINLKSINLLNKDVNIGFSALMHFYTRTGSLMNYGGTFGFMLNTRAEFNYLLGGSLILGQKQRFIINGGAAFGQVNRLNPKYSMSKTYAESEFGQVSDSQLTIKKWEVGYFLGISYNLGNIK